jgi:phosphoglycerate dehydrogenase-like enzyme
MSKPKVWYIQPEGHTRQVFRPEHFQRMLDEFDVTVNPEPRNLPVEELAAGIAGYDAMVTGWGAPMLTDGFFENADKLQIIAHSAGSVKAFLTQELVARYMLPRNIACYGSNLAIAYNVAESAVGMILMTSRLWPHFIDNFRETGTWRPDTIRWNGRYLLGSKVGIVSASAVGRHVIRLLQPWDLDILIYDPYLSDDEAARLNVTKVSLEDLFAQSDHVTVHAPSIPATDKMIGAKHLKLMKDGATLVNTSRGSVIDHDALLAECRLGRIYVCLDVTTPEPLPEDSPFRELSNVYITPHISGCGHYGYFKIGEMTVQALIDFFAGRPVRGQVDLGRFELLA